MHRPARWQTDPWGRLGLVRARISRPVVRNLDALPSEQPSVDRPGPGPQQGQRQTHRTQQNRRPCVGWIGKGMGERLNRQKNPRDGHPKSHDEGDPENCRERLIQMRRERARTRQAHNSVKRQVRSERQADEQQSSSRGAACESGIKPAHISKSVPSLGARRPPNGAEKGLFWGARTR